MKTTQYLKQNWDKVSLLFMCFFSVAGISLLAVDLYREEKIKILPFEELAKKEIPEVISRFKYEKLLAALKEPYIADRAHLRNVFSQHKKEIEFKPAEVKKFATIQDRLEVTKVFKKPIKLLFKGYMQMPDGTYVATINWAGKTDFMKIGDEIRGYKVVAFTKDVSEQETSWGGTEKLDNSTIAIERLNGGRINLIIGKITMEKEIFAEIIDRKTNKKYEIHIGGGVLNYKILDISPQKVIIMALNGKEEVLPKSR